VLTGALAAFTVIPTAIPLSARLEAAQEAETLRHVARVAQVAGGLYQDAALLPGSTDRLGVAHLSVHANSGATLEVQGAPLDVDLLRAACQAPPTPQFVLLSDGARWATACAWSSETMTIAATPPESRPVSRQVFFLVFFLSVIVGIVTALGVLRILSPLNRVSEAMRRISSGERAVRVEETGFAELDAIIEQVNATSQAVDDRQDAIVGRIHVVQEMARLVAHEVRNPLGVIFNSLGSLRRILQPIGDAAMLLEIVGEEADRLNRIVGDLLDFARPVEPAVEAESLEALLEDCLERVRHDPAAREVRIVRDLPAELPAVRVDARMIRQVLLNLLLNAVQAMPTGGTLTVAARNEPLAGREAIRLDVSDTGSGIAPEFRGRIFQPFFTTKASGTGLGLAVVRRIVDAHRGEVAVETSPGRGTTFTLRLPVDGWTL